jgi:hypothetical protein
MGFGNRPGGGNGTWGNQRFNSTSLQYPQMDHKAIADFIQEFSVAIKYWKAIQCPCTNSSTGQPNISCHTCKGLGWAYTEPEQAPEYFRAQVHNRSSSKKDGKGGYIQQGEASITFLPGVIPGDGDLIQVCQDKEIVNDEYHVVGSTLNDGTTAERLRFRDVVCVETVIVFDAVKKQVVKTLAGDWSYDEEQRRIVWNNGLPVGSKYSVRYVAVPEYIVLGNTSKPLLRVAHDDNLPDPMNTTKDVVYPFNVRAVRLDRAILQRNRGNIDLEVPSTFNNNKPAVKKGPFS